jgi:hypothetical protein
MEEEDLILLSQEINRQQQPMLTTLRSINDTLEKLPFKTNKSITLTVDLTRAHVDSALNITRKNRAYLWLTIERADSPFTYRLGQLDKTKSELFTGAIGAGLFIHEFTEIYITNAAAIGIAVILVGWRE